AADEIHQRRLPGTRGSHDRDVLAALDGNRDAAKRVNLFRSHDVGLPEIDRFNQGHDAYFASRSRARRLLATLGASVGTCASQLRASIGMSVILRFSVLRRCSAMALA